MFIMQTFLPYANFSKSAFVLDRQRLGKQRVETLQILNTLFGIKKGWSNHPVVNMWRGYENALALYGITICEEWIKRGYKDTCKDKIKELIKHSSNKIILPSFIGNVNFHISHQSNLVRKNPEHYKKYFPNVPDNLEYLYKI